MSGQQMTFKRIPPSLVSVALCTPKADLFRGCVSPRSRRNESHSQLFAQHEMAVIQQPRPVPFEIRKCVFDGRPAVVELHTVSDQMTGFWWIGGKESITVVQKGSVEIPAGILRVGWGGWRRLLDSDKQLARKNSGDFSLTSTMNIVLFRCI